MADEPSDSDAPVSIGNASNHISLLWPFLTGAFFLLLIVGIVTFGDEPSPAQFMIYRIVIALGGAGFAVALTGQLEIAFPIFQRGSIKAAAAFAVFVILYFFTPASLVADEGERQSQLFIREYNDPTEVVGKAAQTLDSYWNFPGTEGAQLADASGAPASELEDRKLPDESDLLLASQLIEDQLESPESSSAFSTIVSFHERVFDCVDTGNCDPGIICASGTGLFQEIERFRNTYCGQIINLSTQMNRDIWEKYMRFSTNTCRTSFLTEYINFDEVHDLQNVCVPVQCWATNMSRPFPCELRQQLIGGVMIPT